jgi:glucosamine-6-phosphate deaminase
MTSQEEHAEPDAARPVRRCTVDRLEVAVYRDRTATGRAAGTAAADVLRRALADRAQVRIMFAAAPSQLEMLHTLRTAPGIDWSRVVAFHMDEYLGLAADAPQTFGRFVTDELVAAVRPGQVHLIAPDGDPAGSVRRYAELLASAPLDIVCLGIGDNGHLAFNDPPDADFDDPEPVRTVELSEDSRVQQVGDGCFARLDDVPRQAITVTIPTLMSARQLVCTAPGESKRAAVARTLTGPVDASCPASVLRRHPNCTLYVDTAAYGDGADAGVR